MGHVAGDDGDLGLEVVAHGLAGHDHVVARAQQVVAAALVHQRVGVEAGRHLGATRGAHQLHVVDVSRTVGPLEGPWQGRGTHLRVEGEGVTRLAVVEGDEEILQLGGNEVPVVQRLLQGVGDTGGVMRGAEVARDNNQLAVARAVLVGGEFHEKSFRSTGQRPHLVF